MPSGHRCGACPLQGNEPVAEPATAFHPGHRPGFALFAEVLPNLETLVLYGTRITDVTLKRLESATRLKILSLGNTRNHRRGARPPGTIAGPDRTSSWIGRVFTTWVVVTCRISSSSRCLNLSCNKKIDDESLNQLKGLSHLHDLLLADTQDH